MNPHELFVDLIRCQLVNPRRNTRRALDAINEGRIADAKMYLRDVQEQIHHAEIIVAEEDKRHTCTCPTCGNVHYIKGGDA